MKRWALAMLLLWTLPAAALELAGIKVESKAKVGAGEDFYRALLRIWLGDKPVDGDLKQGMLGQGG